MSTEKENSREHVINILIVVGIVMFMCIGMIGIVKQSLQQDRAEFILDSLRITTSVDSLTVSE